MIRTGAKETLQVGLTDDPEAVRKVLGEPSGWQLFGPFHTEAAALRWQQALAGLPGCASLPPGAGWRFGFYYARTAAEEARDGGAGNRENPRALSHREEGLQRAGRKQPPFGADVGEGDPTLPAVSRPP